MYLQQIRNATIFLCYGGKKFLIDPVLTPKGNWPLCSLNRYLLNFFQLIFQVVQKQRINNFMNIFNTGVVHTAGASCLRIQCTLKYRIWISVFWFCIRHLEQLNHSFSHVPCIKPFQIIMEYRLVFKLII